MQSVQTHESGMLVCRVVSRSKDDFMSYDSAFVLYVAWYVCFSVYLADFAAIKESQLRAMPTETRQEAPKQPCYT